MKDKLYISGNHEVYSGCQTAHTAASQGGFIDLDNQILNIDGLRFVGIASPRLNPAEQ